MKIHLLLLLFVCLLFSCNKESLNDNLAQESELIESSTRGKLPLAKLCCQGTSLTSELIENDGICCTHLITFVPNQYNTGTEWCSYNLFDDRTPIAINQQGGQIITWESEICVNDDGSCASKEILAYSVGTSKALPCKRITISTDCDCPYTYNQGVAVGSSLAQQGQCDKSYPQYINTITDFSCMCPSYVNGINYGWNAFCNSGCQDASPFPDCVCVNSEWDCNQ